MTDRHIVTGRVIAVQEERLLIVTVTGQSLLLTLAKNARIPADLAVLQHTQAPVRVDYTGSPNLLSGVIHRIDLL